jgi:ornithine cyclodeaminase
MVRGRVYCDNMQSIMHVSGDFLIPLHEGRYDEKHLLGPVGDIMLGRLSGRSGPKNVTIFDAVGMAVEDMACAIWLYEQAVNGGE